MDRIFKFQVGVALFAFLALAGLMGVLALNPAQPTEAQTPTDPTIIVEKLVPYEENGERAVSTFNSTGLDARKVFWYLEGTDESKFKLGSFTGRTTTLLFKSSPDFEGPTGGTPFDANNDGSITPDDEEGAGANNSYKVTVRAGDGGANKSKKFEVTVEVTNAKELGKIKLTPIQPQVTRRMTADLSDPDRVNPDALNFSWTSSATMNGSYTPITGALNQDTYTPRTTDVGRYIRVKATYRDGATRGEETAMAEATSDFAVEAQPFPNVAPVFADQNPGNGTTGAVADLLTTRIVDEELPADTLVGPPVTAVDHDGDVLTYALLDGDGDATDSDTDTDTPSNMDGESRHFDIDPKTGQITTNKSLEADGDTDVTCGTDNVCLVMVTATDPSGLATVLPQLTGTDTGAPTGDNAANVIVSIKIDPVNESPGGIGTSPDADFAPGDVAPNPPENTEKYQDREEGLPTSTVLATYTADDPDGTTLGPVIWRVAGPDASAFNINNDSGSEGELTFADIPDYDDPADENEDNVYELIVVASDRQFNVSTLWVTIKVADVAETGEVSYNKRHPAIGEAITAELEDPDGVSGSVNWQWHRVTAATTAVEDANRAATAIAGATSATYRPKVDTDPDLTDVGKYLKAVATYSDKQAPGTQRRAGGDTSTIKHVTDANIGDIDVATTNMVLAIPDSNTDPAFNPDHTTTRKYYVAENTTTVVQDAAVGGDAVPGFSSVVTETAGQTLTWSVEGRDAKYFKITGSVDDPADDPSSTPEGMLSPEDDLDFEDPGRGSYPARVTYSIMVRATDPFGSSAEVPVTIVVTDVAENPKIDDPPSGSPVSVMVHGETVEAPMAVIFDENGTGAVADFSAKDPDGDSIAWSVVATTHPDSGETGFDSTLADTTSVDNAQFEINSLTGVLTFKSPPNYEDKKDIFDPAAGNATVMDNIYQVTVRARSLDTVGGSSDDERDMNATYPLKVKVLNVSENPVFRISSSSRSREEDHGLESADTRGPDRPIGGAPVTATDPDNTDAATDEIPAVADTLTYTLEGADAASFSIVPATGQLLTKDVLDYETKSAYSVVVKASDASETDPTKRDDTIDIGIDVLDEIEIAPVGLTVEGQPAVSYTENGTAIVAEYTAVGEGADMVRWIPLEGPDADYFMVDGSGSSIMLKFRDSPDYEMPRGMAMSATNTNTYNLTVKIEHTPSGGTAELPVVVTVDDTAELGMLDGDGTVTYDENGTDAVGAYMVDGPMAAYAMWSLSGDDMAQFALDTTTGSSVMLMFADPPNYEMPRGMAMSATNTNTYMVTVKAMVGGEMQMQDVTVSVTDANGQGYGDHLAAATPVWHDADRKPV